jgi:hypothetical protein
VYLKKTKTATAVTSYGTQGLPAPDPSSFTDWDNLDEFTVLSWATNEMGEEQVAAIEASIDAQIAEKANPTSGTGVPW